MQQSVFSHLRRSSRGVTPWMMMIALALAATASAAVPTLTSFTAVPISPLEATVTATVGNGGTPPIFYRGFVYSETLVDSTPQRGEGHVEIGVPGTVGVMTRNIFGLRPNVPYSVQAYAQNPSGTAYSGVQSFVAPCPVVTLPPLPNGAVGHPYISYVTAAGGFGSDGYAVTPAGSLPPGIDLYASGSFAYLWAASTPTTVGTYNFTITATDLAYGTGCFASRNYTVTIASADVSPRKLAFASELAGNTSSSRRVTITNNQGVGVPLAFPFVFTGPFSQSDTTCANPLPLNTSCTVDVVFTAPVLGPLGPYTGTLDLGPLGVVSLRGTKANALVPQVYVSNLYDATVSVIDPTSNAVRVVVPVRGGPSHLAALPGGGKVYVPNRDDNTVSVISTATNMVLTTIDETFSAPYAVAPTPLGDEVWVVNQSNKTVTIIDTLLDSMVAEADGETCLLNPEGIVANPRTHEMYVLSTGNGSVCVFDRVTRRYLRSIYVGGSPGYGVVLPDGSALYVNRGSFGPARVDLASGAVTYISLPPGDPVYNMDMKVDGSKIYVARYENGFGYIDTATNTYTQIPLTGSHEMYGVAIDAASGRIFTSDQGDNVVYVVDLNGNVELPNPELPIEDPSFKAPSAIAAIKAAGPTAGLPPTVATLPGATVGSVTATVNGNVIANGGMPIFERGFAYSDTDLTPEPGEPGVSTVVVSGGLGPMSGTLPNLFTDATYRYQAYAKNLMGTALGGVLTFTTTGVCASIEIGPSALPNGIVGSPYSPSTPFTATGKGGPYAFSYVGLPPGLIGSAAGAVSGSPTAAGTYTVEVVATEAITGCWASRTMDLLIGSSVSAGSVVISEFRTRGPGEPAFEVPGNEDEYVEIGNRTSADIVVSSTDGSGGWSIGRPGEVVALIPDGTVIKKGGHWLATGPSFSLYDYGVPESVWYGDDDLLTDLPDDTGIALFTTADFDNYTASTRLDAVGGAKEADPLFFEGTPLVEVVQAGPTDPEFQTAWVRRVDNSGILSDTGDNDRDFIFVATDAGLAYGPLGDVKAVLGGPGPEDSDTVHDVLQSEFTASLLDPSQGQDRQPNRYVEPYQWVDYRRVFKNNTGKDITALAFKVINVTTQNSRPTLAVQAELTPATAPPVQLEVPPGSNNFVDMLGTNLDYDGMYPVTAYSETRSYYCGESCVVAPPACDYIIDGYCYYTFFHKAGGINSRLIVPFGGRFGPPQGLSELKGPIGSTLPPGESVGVNFRAGISSRGYYLWVILPQISFEPLSCNCELDALGGAVKPRRERRDRTSARPAARKR